MVEGARQEVIIGILNGPNLNLLGTREPSVYGTRTLQDIETHLQSVALTLGASVRAAQWNGEGQLIDQVQQWRNEVAGVVINAGAYTHTSLALRDAFTATGLPFIEVHISNVHAREPERHHSMLASAAIGSIVGLGTDGYEYALRALINVLLERARPSA